MTLAQQSFSRRKRLWLCSGKPAIRKASMLLDQRSRSAHIANKLVPKRDSMLQKMAEIGFAPDAMKLNGCILRFIERRNCCARF
jgi:hypothetical protein